MVSQLYKRTQLSKTVSRSPFSSAQVAQYRNLDCQNQKDLNQTPNFMGCWCSEWSNLPDITWQISNLGGTCAYVTQFLFHFIEFGKCFGFHQMILQEKKTFPWCNLFNHKHEQNMSWALHQLIEGRDMEQKGTEEDVSQTWGYHGSHRCTCLFSPGFSNDFYCAKNLTRI